MNARTDLPEARLEYRRKLLSQDWTDAALTQKEGVELEALNRLRARQALSAITTTKEGADV